MSAEQPIRVWLRVYSKHHLGFQKLKKITTLKKVLQFCEKSQAVR